MKKFAVILMLITGLLIGGVTADARTSHKKFRNASQVRKNQNAKTSSPSWNGDIPSASFLYEYCEGGIWDEKILNEFLRHGYKLDGENYLPSWYLEKPGVALYTGLEVGFHGFSMKIYDKAQRDKLYNELYTLKTKKNLKEFVLRLEDDTISFFYKDF